MSRLQSIGVVLFAFPLLAAAQESARISRLDQEVRQLQREVVTLTQLVNQLRNEVHRAATTVATAPLPAPGSARTAAPPQASAVMARWVDAGRWQRLKVGMSELEVIGELGPPTSIRSEGDAHILFYALELGPGAFLAGSIRLQDQAVTSIETPALK